MSHHSSRKGKSAKQASRRARTQAASTQGTAPKDAPHAEKLSAGSGARSSERRHARREAAIRRERQKKQMRLIIGGVVAAALIATVLIFLNRPEETSASIDYDGIDIAQPLVAQAGGTPPAAPTPYTGAVVGDPDAPVTFVIYSDFRCHFCQQFHEETYPKIVEDFVRTGEVKVEFRDFPALGGGDLYAEENTSARSAEALLCAAEQDAYIDYHATLFGNFSADGSTYAPDRLRGYAEDEGLDLDAFDACLASDRHVPALEQSMAEGQAQGITATPMFLIDNGTGEPNVVQQTSAGYDLLKKQIQAAIDTAQ